MGMPNSEPNDCVHYWLIEAPEGPTSKGRCKFCGLVREFNNTWADTFNEHQIVSEKNKAATREPANMAV